MFRVKLEETCLHIRSLWSAGEEVKDPAAQVCIEAQVDQLGGKFMGRDGIEGGAIVYE